MAWDAVDCSGGRGFRWISAICDCEWVRRYVESGMGVVVKAKNHLRAAAWEFVTGQGAAGGLPQSVQL